MNEEKKAKRVTVSVIAKMKQRKEKIAMLTAYDYGTAKIMDEAGIDMILVGDSLGMVVLGYDSTLPVTMEDMIHHAKAVSRAVTRAMVIVDMPFMSYQADPNDAIRNAGRLIKETGGHGIKLEGGCEYADLVKRITTAGIPVMAHLGLTPQSVNQFGGFKVQGKEERAAQKIIEDSIRLQDAGAFSIVLECVPATLAKKVTESLAIPTIGIGAGAGCDGQVLVVNDMLGMFSAFTPKFVQKYDHLSTNMESAFRKYIEEVKDVEFPRDEHSF